MHRRQRLIFRFVPDIQQPLSARRREVVPTGGLEWRQSSTPGGFIRSFRAREFLGKLNGKAFSRPTKTLSARSLRFSSLLTNTKMRFGVPRKIRSVDGGCGGDLNPAWCRQYATSFVPVRGGCLNPNRFECVALSCTAYPCCIFHSATHPFWPSSTLRFSHATGNYSPKISSPYSVRSNRS